MTAVVFLWGTSALASAAAGVFFFRFWRDTGDRLFALFAVALWAMSINWIGLAATTPQDEARTYFFLVRLVAFSLIIGAVIEKNRAGKH